MLDTMNFYYLDSSYFQLVLTWLLKVVSILLAPMIPRYGIDVAGTHNLHLN